MKEDRNVTEISINPVKVKKCILEAGKVQNLKDLRCSRLIIHAKA